MSEQKTRLCKYGCGTELYWDNAARAYMEVKLRRTHKDNCSKFKDIKQVAQQVEQEITSVPKPPSTQQGLVQEQVNQGAKIQRIEQEIAEIKRTLHDLGKAVAQMSNKTAAELMKEEVVQED